MAVLIIFFTDKKMDKFFKSIGYFVIKNRELLTLTLISIYLIVGQWLIAKYQLCETFSMCCLGKLIADIC